MVMAHYAFIDPDTMVVTEVITGVNEDDEVNGIVGTEAWEAFYETLRPGMLCKRTSYNGNIRKRFAGVGDWYLVDDDAFAPPPPKDGLVFDKDLWAWILPELNVYDCECGATYDRATGKRHWRVHPHGWWRQRIAQRTLQWRRRWRRR